MGAEMPMFHAYCKNSAEHAKLANQVAISMNKTLKPSLRARCEFAGYRGSGHYYYFVNAIRVISYAVLDSGYTENRYTGEYRRDYVYSDDDYNKDIFVDGSLDSVFLGRRALKTDIYKKSFFEHVSDEKKRYKLDGIYINDIQNAVVNGRRTAVVMLKAGLNTGDIVSIDNRDCFLIKDGSDEYCGFYAIAID